MTIKVRESKKTEATTEDISVKLAELKDVLDAGKVLDDLKKLGFNTIEYGDYASKDKAYAVLKHPNGMYAELDYTWVQDSSGRDSYSPGEVVAYDYFKDKDEYEEIHGYSPNESRKKSEGISDMIDAKIDYNMFMRMCKTAAYLKEDEDYWDALWEYYSDLGSIGDALVFFDNLFQYTAWKDVDETYDELKDEYKDESKSKEECIERAIDEGALDGVYPYGDHYLWIY